jgi:hypothetical protein
VIRRKWLVVVAIACTGSESERARQAAERREARDSLLTTEVVESLKTPTSAGRLIYERPADLSYDSLRLKRPDLVLAADRRKR